MKNEIRQQVANKRKSLSKNEITSLSELVRVRLTNLPYVREAGQILFYSALPSEVQTLSLIHSFYPEKKIWLPVVTGDTLEVRAYEGDHLLRKGSFGVYEPTGELCPDLEAIDLVIVPGVAFSTHDGMRLGYGKGYYDRLLTLMKARRVGLAFEFQLFDRLPFDPHDMYMDEVVTERRHLVFPHAHQRHFYSI